MRRGGFIVVLSCIVDPDLARFAVLMQPFWAGTYCIQLFTTGV